MKRVSTIVLICLAAAVPVQRLPAQQPQQGQQTQQPPPPPGGKGDTKLIKRVDLVNVIATVVNSRQRFVTDLEKPDFTVAEDALPQSIQFFNRATDLPLRVGLLMDTSNSIRERLKFEQEAAIDFLHNTLRRKKDQAFLMIFDNEPSVVQDFTDDLNSLTESIQKQRAGGGTALYDAIAVASTKLAEAPVPPGSTYGDVRRVLVVISDGDDNLSGRSRGEAIELAARAEAAIYSISSSTEWVSATEERDSVKRVQRKYQLSDSDKVLEQFANETGGRVFFPYKLDDLAQSFQDIGEELRSQYQIAYSPTNKQFDGKFRHIKVTVGRKGLIVRARRGYYAQRVEGGGAPSGSGSGQ
jgi:Ca-activated chloride channel family protein